MEKGIFAPVDLMAGYDTGDQPATAPANVSDLLKDAAFLTKLRRYYSEVEGKTFSSDADLVENWFEDRTWRELNLVSTAKDAYLATTASPEQRALMREIKDVYDQLPDFWQEGGRGFWEWAKDAALPIALDPLNLLPGGKALVAGKVAAGAARTAGKTGVEAALQAVKAGVKEGVKYDVATNAAGAALADIPVQMRDTELGLQDGYDPMQTAAQAAIGGAIGVGTGTLIGGGAGLAGAVAERMGNKAGQVAGGAAADTARNLPAIPGEPIKPTPPNYADMPDAEILANALDDLDEQIRSYDIDGLTTDDEQYAQTVADRDWLDWLRGHEVRKAKMQEELAKLREDTKPESLEKLRATREQLTIEENRYRRTIERLRQGFIDGPEQPADEPIPQPAPEASPQIGQPSPIRQPAPDEMLALPAPDEPRAAGATPTDAAASGPTIEAGAPDAPAGLLPAPPGLAAASKLARLRDPGSPYHDQDVEILEDLGESYRIRTADGKQFLAGKALFDGPLATPRDFEAPANDGTRRAAQPGTTRPDMAPPPPPPAIPEGRLAFGDAVEAATSMGLDAKDAAATMRAAIKGVKGEAAKSDARKAALLDLHQQAVQPAVAQRVGRVLDMLDLQASSIVLNDPEVFRTIVEQIDANLARNARALEAYRQSALTAARRGQEMADIANRFLSGDTADDMATPPGKPPRLPQAYVRDLEDAVTTFIRALDIASPDLSPNGRAARIAGYRKAMTDHFAKRAAEDRALRTRESRGFDPAENGIRDGFEFNNETGRFESNIITGRKWDRDYVDTITGDTRVIAEDPQGMIAPAGGKTEDGSTFFLQGGAEQRAGDVVVNKRAERKAARQLAKAQAQVNDRGKRTTFTDKQMREAGATSRTAVPAGQRAEAATTDEIAARELEQLRSAEGAAGEPAEDLDAQIMQAMRDVLDRAAADGLSAEEAKARLASIVAPGQKAADQVAQPAATQTAGGPASAGTRSTQAPVIPEGRVLAIQHKTRKDRYGNPEVRVMSPGQQKAGADASALLGKSSPDDWITGHVAAGAKSGTRAAGESFAPIGEAPVAPSSPIGRPNTRTGSKLPSFADLSEIKLNFRGQDMTAQDLWFRIQDLESQPFSAEGRMLAVAQELREAYALMPEFRLPNAWRRGAMDQVRDLFAATDPQAVVWFRNVLRRLGGDQQRAPNIMAVEADAGAHPKTPGRYVHSRRNEAYTEGTAPVNTILLATDKANRMQQVPLVSVMAHELAHWAYRNILSNDERVGFWELMARKMADDPQQFPRRSMDDSIGLPDPIEGGKGDLYSPQEYFARQFEIYVAQAGGRRPEDDTFWRGLLRKFENVVRAYFSKEKLDEDLLPYFQRILPDDMDPMERARYPHYDIGNRSLRKFPGLEALQNAQYQARMHRVSIEEALDSGDPIGSLGGFGGTLDLAARWAYGMRKFESLPAVHQRRAYFTAAQVFSFLNEASGLTGEDLVQATKRMLPEMTEQDLAGFTKIDFGRMNAASGSHERELAAVRLGQMVSELMHDIEREAGKSFKHIAGPMPEFPDVPMAKRNVKSEKYKKVQAWAKKAAKRQTDVTFLRTSREAEDVVKQPRAARPAEAPKVPVNKAAAPAAQSLTDQSIREELRKVGAKSRRGQDLLMEVQRRIQAKPELERPAMIDPDLAVASAGDLRARLGALVEQGPGADKDLAMQIRWLMWRRGQPAQKPQAARIISAIRKELLDSTGITTDDGIPANARQIERELLRRMHDRDPVRQRTSRTLLYRMLNLLGGGVRRNMDDLNVMTVGDVYRMAGMEPPADATAAFADFRSPAYEALRPKLRRLSIGLTDGVSSPTDVIHEVGHLAFRTSLTNEQRAFVRQAFIEAFQRDEALAAHIVARYGQPDGLSKPALKSATSRRAFLRGAGAMVGSAVMPKIPSVRTALSMARMLGDVGLKLVMVEVDGVHVPSIRQVIKMISDGEPDDIIDMNVPFATDLSKMLGKGEIDDRLITSMRALDQEDAADWAGGLWGADAEAAYRFSAGQKEAYSALLKYVREKGAGAFLDELQRGMRDIARVDVTPFRFDADAFYAARDKTTRTRSSADGSAATGHSITVDQAAEEWFSEGLAQYQLGRVAKGDIFKARTEGAELDLAMRSGLSRLVNTFVEAVAYLVNGLIGRRDIKQLFRSLTDFGDMFATVRKPASRFDGKVLVQPDEIASFTAEVAAKRSPARLKRIKSFLAGGWGVDADGNPRLFFHGTPNAGYFDRNIHPDVELEPSEVGHYGPGIYVTAAEDAAIQYSRMPTGAALQRAIDKARLTGDDFDTANAMAARLLDLFRQRSDAAKRLALGADEDMLPVDDAREMLLHSLREAETQIEAIKRRMDRMGVELEEGVLPVYARLTNPFDARADRTYAIDGTELRDIWNELDTFLEFQGMDDIRDMARDTYAEMSHLASAVGTGAVSGQEVYEALALTFARADYSPKAAKGWVTQFLSSYGYDGIVTTHSNTLPSGRQLDHETLVLFDSEQVKHVDASRFDDLDPRLYQSRIADDGARPNALLMQAMMSADTTPDPQRMAAFADAMDASGAPAGFAPVASKIASGSPLTKGEANTVGSFSWRGALSSNAHRMRQAGFRWVADWIAPEDGTGFYEARNAEMANIVTPLLNVLHALPDAKNGIARWLHHSAPMLSNPLWKPSGQPDSYARILKAVRRGPDSRHWKGLTSQEAEAAALIRRRFADELRSLRKSGIVVASAGDNYAPQVWDTDAIAAKRDDFQKALADYFVEEARLDPERENIGLAEALDRANGVIETLLGEDGIILPSYIGHKGKEDSLDFQRMIRLEDPRFSKHLDTMEDFLVNDLEGLLVKYYDGTVRRRQMVEKWGHSNHAFHDYMLVASHGINGIYKLLTTSKVLRRSIANVDDDGVSRDIHEIPLMAAIPEDKAANAVRELATMAEAGDPEFVSKARAILTGLRPHGAETFLKRVDAIVNALQDFGPTGIQDPQIAKAHRWSEEFFTRTMQHRPVYSGSSMDAAHNGFRLLRNFNSVTLLGYTTLASLPDMIMPLIRSGNFSAWAKGLAKYMTNREYRQGFQNAGVAIENLVYERMAGLYGAAGGKRTNAFFNAIGLTPWTNFVRGVAGAVALEAFKAEARVAQRLLAAGNEKSLAYRRAKRFLMRFGLEEYASHGARSMDSISFADDPRLQRATIRFANESVFTPNSNDIPKWAQDNPFGQLVFQLKSFPLMMMRLSGRVLDEARQGNVAPLAYMATLGTGAGMASLAVNDIARSRGGDDEQSPMFRERSFTEIAKNFGWEPDLHGPADEYLGWAVEGFLALGGFGLIGDMLYQTAQQVDNGAWGFQRALGVAFGPSVSLASGAFNVVAGGVDALTSGPTDGNGKPRQAVREIAQRIPLAGGNRSFRETMADYLAGEARDGGAPSSHGGFATLAYQKLPTL